MQVGYKDGNRGRVMIKAIPMEDWLRGCIYHDGRSGYVTLPTDKVLEIADYIQHILARNPLPLQVTGGIASQTI